MASRLGNNDLLKTLQPARRRRVTKFTSRFTNTDRRFVDMKSLIVLFAGIVFTAAAADLPTNRIDQITGLKGKWNSEEGVYKISLPRTDVKVKIDNWQMPPFMGLTSWAAFTTGKEKLAMVMGDQVLLQDEVNPVMSAALETGIAV